MRLLVDTATFLWTVLGSPQLSADARAALADPSNESFLSAVSAAEIAIKHGLGRLKLPRSPDVYVPQVRRAHQIDALPFSEEAALGLVRLPSLHRDPFDRMLIAQAIADGMTLVTPDPLITQYAVRTLW